MQLIKEGKIGDHLRSRGGNRYTYNKYAFVKMKKNIDLDNEIFIN